MSKVNMADGRTISGSITVFASLSLLLVASFLLALLECARVKGLEAYSGMQRENALECVLSEYDRDLFERYGIFLLDGGYGTGTIQFAQMNGRLLEISQKNLRPEKVKYLLQGTQNFYQMDVTQAEVEQYLLATDYNGAPFRAMAVQSMKARYPIELLQTLSDRLQQSERAMDEARAGQTSMDQAGQQIEHAKRQAAEQAAASAANGEAAAPPAQVPENPMDIIKSIKTADILTLVVPQGMAISAKQINGDRTLEHRHLVQGNESWEDTGEWYEAVLYQQFLQTQFGCFTSGCTSGGALDYELEYIQSGKTSDRANLKGVVHALLLLREGANYLYLQSDQVKQAQAYELAGLIASALAIAPATPLLAQGILAAWAYAESILDVRTLLSGGCIPWMKTADSWSSDLSGIGTLLAGNAQAKSTTQGEDYQGYLQKLLYLKTAKVLNYRAMDLVEWYKTACSDRQIHMDAMLLAVRATFSYEARPLFSDLVTLQRLEADQLEFAASEADSYLTGDRQRE